MKFKKLSIIIPVYNERATVEELFRRVRAVSLPMEREIIAVDDASTDGTSAILTELLGDDMKLFHHEKNEGKGASIRTALEQVTGDIVLIQDADLEYDPKDYEQLLGPMLDGRADVVYGSRFLGGPHRVLLFWHYLANAFFTFMTNLLYNVNLTDMGVCYKVFRTEVIKSLPLYSNRFGFEPEVTAKICKRKARIYEVPISYSGRTYAEGKKIGLRDAFAYLWCLLRYRIAD